MIILITWGNQIRDAQLGRAQQRPRRRQPLPNVVGGEPEDGGGGGRARRAVVEDVDAVSIPEFGWVLIFFGWFLLHFGFMDTTLFVFL